MASFGKDTWKVATTYIGTVVGAGFASGQEVLRFFSSHGLAGIPGVLLATGLFALGGILLLFIGNRLKAVSYKEVMVYVCGKRLGRVLEILITCFLFGTLSVMLAGSGAVLVQQLHIPYLAGTILTVGLTLFTLLHGMKGIINANSIVVPLLTLSCLIVGIYNIRPDFFFTHNPAILNTSTVPYLSPHWTISALIYVAYNLSLSTGILAPLGNQLPHRKSLLLGGITGGLVLGFLAFLINLSILSNLSTLCFMEIPMLKLAENIGKPFQIVYAIILWAEIFTTIIGNTFSVTTHISEVFNLSYNRTLIIILLLAMLFSQMGFSTLVGFLYPLFGYVSLLFLAGLFSKPFRRR